METEVEEAEKVCKKLIWPVVMKRWQTLTEWKID